MIFYEFKGCHKYSHKMLRGLAEIGFTNEEELREFMHSVITNLNQDASYHDMYIKVMSDLPIRASRCHYTIYNGYMIIYHFYMHNKGKYKRRRYIFEDIIKL